MRDILEAVAAGDLSVAAAEAELAGYATDDVGRFDAARETRSGVPEAVYGTGKTTEEICGLVATSLETTGRAIATRLSMADASAVRERLRPEFEGSLSFDERSGVLRAHAPEFERRDLDATVGIVTAGTADGGPAGEAAAIVSEMGATVKRIDDVGVAGIHRLFDNLANMRAVDVLIVAAGREGALPTVIAGLVDVPVIALPIASGYGRGGDGEAALLGMLQSCTMLTTVNVDAGFVAGAQAGLIARRLHAARNESA
ncbi:MULTISPECIES: nickel pincer cofactor biosynthesis protein LarB [unclassified Haladaptatus]|uniref:nickel pincer cofactor biosynthesis protein LarB n=1 Tax=unclassified Haladaptatus TaxID=2622732 RepID=UPI0023E89374|nr:MULTISPECIES: nickel pincer cofactor biosynthesis protein LarB [unclassified Haladaptatus]